MADFAVDALQALERCPSNSATEHAAAHAAWLASRAEDALRHARAGRGADADPHYPWLLALTPARVRYDAFDFALRSQRAAGGAGTDELLEDCRMELAVLLAADPQNVWTWRAYAANEAAAGAPEEALAVLERAIDRLPREYELWNDWRLLARQHVGLRGAAERAEALALRHGQSAPALFHAGSECFEAALEQLNSDPLTARDGFLRAQEWLTSARATDPAWDASVRDREVVCRAGLGWSALGLGRAEEAELAFRSMDEVVPGGLRYSIEGRLGSGIAGLDAVGRELAQRYSASRELASLERAAAIYATLRDSAPTDGEESIESDWPRRAGVFQRELALELARRAQLCCVAARDGAAAATLEQALRALEPDLPAELSSPAGREALLARADLLAARARDRMRESWSSYRAALGPESEDVRMLNDAALVQVQYLREDLAGAEALLRRSVELGERQLADPTLSQRARYELQNAWGDAHQSLGVLELVHRGDKLTARLWFEKALSIGPDPRPIVSDEFLPACADGSDPERLPEAIAIRSWGEVCPRP
ncbi:MAG: hypothetical protein FJ299_02105 [Planctomycetes bacterium]|nr:hypothetical protein [Planctomycetota bacterium]